MRLLIGQLIGFLATGFLIASFQCKSSHKLILLQLLSNGSNIVHFFLLDALSGSFSTFCGLARCVVLYEHKRKWAQWKGWLPTFIILNIIGTVLTYESIFSILPAIAVISTTIGSWSRNGKLIRLANTFFACPSWLIYGIHARSVSLILCELFCLSSIAVSFYRYGWKALDGEGVEKPEETSGEK